MGLLHAIYRASVGARFIAPARPQYQRGLLHAIYRARPSSQRKKPFIPSLRTKSHCSRVTTFIRCCLTTTTSRSTYVLLPDYGGLRRVLVLLLQFLLAAPGSFSRSRHTSFPPTARSLRIPEHRYSSLSKLSTLCSCILASFRVITCPFSNVKDLSSQYYRTRKEKALLTIFRYIVWLKVIHENSYYPL